VIAWVRSVVAEEINCLPSFQVNDPKMLPLLYDAPPRAASFDDDILDNSSGDRYWSFHFRLHLLPQL
jgi:hypothetical protein